MHTKIAWYFIILKMFLFLYIFCIYCILLVFNEATSDSCFTSLFNLKKGGKCTINMKCGKAVTTPNLQNYPLTHQILFSVEADKSVSLSLL